MYRSFLLLFLWSAVLSAQTPEVPERDLNLINYDYGYPVAYFTVAAICFVLVIYFYLSS